MAHILVIDDDPFYLRTIARILRALGHTSQGAGNGQEALDMLQDQIFYLVISDTNMPFLDGPAFVREFRRTNKVTPIVMNSGAGLQDEVRELLQSGDIQDFVDKGIPLAKWREVLLRLIPPTTP